MATPSSICYSIITSIFAATAFLLCWAAEFGCKFVSFTSTSGFETPVTVNFGIWTYQFWTIATSVSGSVIFESCHSYGSEYEVDSFMKMARAFSTLALIFGGTFLFANLISSCISPLQNTPRIEAPAFLLAMIFQSLSFLILHSSICKNNTFIAQLISDTENLGTVGMDFPDTCSLSTGGKCTIASIVFWFMAFLSSSMGVVAEKKAEKEEENTLGTEPLILPGENL